MKKKTDLKYSLREIKFSLVFLFSVLPFSVFAEQGRSISNMDILLWLAPFLIIYLIFAMLLGRFLDKLKIYKWPSTKPHPWSSGLACAFGGLILALSFTKSSGSFFFDLTGFLFILVGCNIIAFIFFNIIIDHFDQ